ncbi:hypothetical protein ABE28_004610 [Peribacillus muralis]|uniref:Uncharacterized protein n=1 Tax=Peribacillus muralis TaxID=264697 RepID=A0A1B3XKC2_9BACI|nr:hypothetical protein ABE28_004610 [Peribacillus muralis]
MFPHFYFILLYFSKAIVPKMKRGDLHFKLALFSGDEFLVEIGDRITLNKWWGMGLNELSADLPTNR